MMFDIHPLHPSRPSPSQKLNRENRIKNACLSNSHSNIAASNDKRPLFMQIPATPSALLVSTSLPIQCLRPSNFFFFRGIFSDNFLPNLSTPRPERITTTSEPIRIRWGGGRNRFRRKFSANIPLKKMKLLGRMHWTGNEVETSEALEVAGICTNKGRLSFEGAMLL